MTVPRISVFGAQVPVPMLVMAWIAAVVAVAITAINNINALAAENPSQTSPSTSLVNGISEQWSWSGPPCLDLSSPNEYWSYQWCSERSVSQIRYDHSFQAVEVSNTLDVYLKGQSFRDDYKIEQWFMSSDASCLPANAKDGEEKQRSAVVSLYCCEEHPVEPEHLVANVYEPQPCHYIVQVCSLDLCDIVSPTAVSISGHHSGRNLSKKKSKVKKLTWRSSETKDSSSQSRSNIQRDVSSKKQKSQHFHTHAPISLEEQAQLKEQVRSMFTHGYDSYMEHAFPNSELASTSCTGQLFDPIKLPLVTLIDTLDTLVVMHNFSEFCKAVKVVEDFFAETLFEFDVNVSVFETTIRVLGGLLSGHMLATDENLGIYTDQNNGEYCRGYDNGLLRLAYDLGERLYPAFSTPTGIPYGTVNLKKGVPPKETTISSTAGAGSLLLEFEVLSRLSGEKKFGVAAKKATDGIVSRKSDVGLYGKHINIKTGKWAETASGIGSNSDSFYEYIIKSHFLFGTPTYDTVFAENYLAVKRFNQHGDWFADVDMHSGQVRRQLAENLQAFWPGVESSLGLTRTSARFLNAMYSVLAGVGFMPEEFDYLRWQLPTSSAGSSSYLLRPELIESTYHHYRSTHDRSWLTPAKRFLKSLDVNTRTNCGYATIDSVDSMGLSDSMPSYFLAETCKYLYLLFDEDNFVHRRPFIFSTEAHLFDALELNRAHNGIVGDISEKTFHENYITKEDEDASGGEWDSSFSNLLLKSLSKCPKKMWWEKEGCFDPEFEDVVSAPLGKAFDIEKVRSIPSHLSYNPHEELFSPPRLFEYWNQNAYPTMPVEGTLALKASGGTCAASDELFYRMSNGKRHVEEDTVDDTNSAETKPLAMSQDHFSYEELRPDADRLSQSATFENTPEGDFVVDVYATGFSVFSKRHKNLLHIFNLGQFTIFSTERDVFRGFDRNVAYPVERRDSRESSVNPELDPVLFPTNSKSLIIGEHSGHVRRCYLQLFPAHELTDLPPTEAGQDVLVSVDQFGGATTINSLRLSELSPVSGKLLSREMCSPAVFGRTSLDFSESPAHVIAPLAVAPDKIGCKLPASTLNKDNDIAEDTDDDTLPHLPYEGKILVVERGSCTFEEKAMLAEKGGAVGIVIINTENSIFTMGGAAESMIKIDLGTGDTQEGSVNVFEMLKAAFSDGPVKEVDLQEALGGAFEDSDTQMNEIRVDAMESARDGNLGIEVGSGSDLANSVLKSMGSLKSSVTSAASSALSALTAMKVQGKGGHNVGIPAVMVPQRYGKELLIFHNHLATKGKNPKILLYADSMPGSLDSTFFEGNTRGEGQEVGRFPKMKIDKDPENPLMMKSVRIWTSKSWGAFVHKTKKGVWELRIMSRYEEESVSIGATEALKSSSVAVSVVPGVIESNPVRVYSLLINRACDPMIFPRGNHLRVLGDDAFD